MENIFVLDVIEELSSENDGDFKREWEEIAFDIRILKDYLYHYKVYETLKKVRNSFLPDTFKNNSSKGFIEDYVNYETKEYPKVLATKGTTKLVLSLLLRELASEQDTKDTKMKDILQGGWEAFYEDNKDTLELATRDVGLLEDCFNVVEKYTDIKGRYYSKYDSFTIDDDKVSELLEGLANFVIYRGYHHEPYDISSETVESYLSKENFLDIIEQTTYNFIESKTYQEAQSNVWGLKLIFARLRMGITDSVALQTKEITKAKGRKNLLDISTSLSLTDLKKEVYNIRGELDELLSPLLDSRFIRYHLYKHYFEQNKKLVLND